MYKVDKISFFNLLQGELVHCLIKSMHSFSQVCDDSNQARGFSLVGTTGGFGRLSVGWLHTHTVIVQLATQCKCTTLARCVDLSR